jgi:hypothetical protein
VPLYINSYQPIRLKSVKCEFTGLNQKDNFKKNLKLKPKPNYLSIRFPENSQFTNNVELVIQKPFSYNITREGEDVQSDQLSENFIMTGQELLNFKEKDLKLVVTPISDYYIFYVDRYEAIESNRVKEIKDNIYSQLRKDIANASSAKADGLLYYSLAAPISYSSFDSTDIFLQKVSQSIGELSGNRLEDFTGALSDYKVDLSRRKVHIKIYLTSYDTYEEFIKKFLLNDLLKLKETETNWANIDITIYVPLNLSPKDREKHQFGGDKLPVIISNWRLVNIL